MLQLRVNHVWDTEAFHRLTAAMRACCQHYEYSAAQRARDLAAQEQLTEEQLEDEQFADTSYIQRNDTPLPRWLASGFWYLSTFARAHTSHPAWHQTLAQEPLYFSHAYEYLDDLAPWFFSGEMPWIDEAEG